jgi:hypothetical protein
MSCAKPDQEASLALLSYLGMIATSVSFLFLISVSLVSKHHSTFRTVSPMASIGALEIAATTVSHSQPFVSCSSCSLRWSFRVRSVLKLALHVLKLHLNLRFTSCRRWPVRDDIDITMGAYTCLAGLDEINMSTNLCLMFSICPSTRCLDRQSLVSAADCLPDCHA